MSKRLARLAACLSSAFVLFVVLPSVSAAASEPWWQVLTGSRPTNMWEPQDNVQVLEAGPQTTLVSVEGTPVACLYSPFCFFFGLPNTETAQQLEEALEAPVAYGANNVEVVEEPQSSRRFVITSVGADAGRPVPRLSIVFGERSRAWLLKEGGSGRLTLTLTNIGGAPVDGSTTPVRIVDHLPEGVAAYSVESVAGVFGKSGPVQCVVEAPDEVACTFEGKLPAFETIEVEITAALTGSPPAAGAAGEVTVSGGNAAAASATQEVKVSPDPVRYGIEMFSAVAEEEGGGPTRQAGAHPFQFTTTIQLNSGWTIFDKDLHGTQRAAITVEQPAMPRNLAFPLPAGLIGNATIMPSCPMEHFSQGLAFINTCPDTTVLGAASVSIIEPNNLGPTRVAVPVFNLPPAEGEPARFGFEAFGAVVIIDTEVDPDNEYRITARTRNVTELAQLLGSTVTFWGTPGDPRHDSARGWSCLYYSAAEVGLHPCERPGNISEAAFQRMPVSCDRPLQFAVAAEPWNVPLGSEVAMASFATPPLIGCNRVPFDPAVDGTPTSKLAENPSGFAFRLDMPNAGLLNGHAIAEGQPKKVTVSLPEGMSINPSEGEGLVGCSPADYARETVESKPGEGCPNASKVGTVDIATPLLDEEAHGALYIATPHDNPSGSLIGLYMVARIRDRGIIVKQAGRVDADPVTGQLTTTFDDLPQVPVSSFNLQFREGGRAPLATPPACGTYPVVTKFVPWAAQDPDNPAPNEIVTRTSSFTVERGVDGGDCPAGGTPSFHPGLDAGSLSNAAGSFSPFNVRLTRKDGEQEFTNFSIKLPPGLSGKLAGIPFCSDAAIAGAKARTGPHGGQEELEAPSCPAASEVGHTLVGAGVGSSLTYVPGKVYLAGPYHGSSLSIAAITAAKVGPFDLGTVVVREALRVNPETAEVFIDATGSDPIPHIIQGIPVHARDIRVYVDRPQFTLNPTSCEPTSVASTVLGSGLDFGSPADDNPVTVTTRYQASDCAALPFRPKLSMRLFGKTHRGANPRLRATLRMNGIGEAAIAKASVTLPHSEFLDQSHIRTVCTRVQFKAGAGNGAECPKGSVYGYARAWTPILDEPIEGPVFLRSSSHPLPDLVAALHGSRIDIDLVGRIDSFGNGRIRNTFEAVPDAPVSKFVLEMQGGKKGLLQNSTDICEGQHRVLAAFTAHNGKQQTQRPALKGDCRGGKGHHGHR